MDTITRLVRRRNLVLALAGSAFFIWQTSELTQDLTVDGTALMSAANIGETIGAITWVVASLTFLAFTFQVRRERAGAIINDEAARHDRARAMAVGYKVMVVTIGVLFLSQEFIDMDAAVALRALLIVAVTAPVSLFLWFSRDSGDVEP